MLFSKLYDNLPFITQKENKNIERARELRKNMTPQEKKLWYQFLSKHKYHWRRQKKIENYYLDFYCREKLFAIEVDGSQHYSESGLIYDRKRTLIINKNNISIYRVTNYDIDHHFIEVCSEINEIIEGRRPSPQSPTVTAPL